jgi:hypothetical protein
MNLNKMQPSQIIKMLLRRCPNFERSSFSKAVKNVSVAERHSLDTPKLSVLLTGVWCPVLKKIELSWTPSSSAARATLARSVIETFFYILCKRASLRPFFASCWKKFFKNWASARATLGRSVSDFLTFWALEVVEQSFLRTGLLGRSVIETFFLHFAKTS